MTMTNEEFDALQLRVMICPQQASWPAPEQTHWQRLHHVANEARTAVQSAYSMMAKIDADASLSREVKAQHRRTIAKQAIADFEASKTLARAREAARILLLVTAAQRRAVWRF